MKKARLLLASDFDGTLAPIVPVPEDAEIDEDAKELLVRASQVPGVVVALLSGRDLEDLSRRSGGIRAIRSGSHGREISNEKGEMIRTEKGIESRPPEEWVRDLEAKGFRLEKKKYGAALHWRGVAGASEASPEVEAFREWAAGEGLTLQPGRAVLEAAQGKRSKRDVIEELTEATGAERVVYAGDDLTDVAAIEWAAERGGGYFVRSSERNETPRNATVVNGIGELLEHFANELRDLEKENRE